MDLKRVERSAESSKSRIEQKMHCDGWLEARDGCHVMRCEPLMQWRHGKARRVVIQARKDRSRLECSGEVHRFQCNHLNSDAASLIILFVLRAERK